MQSKLRVLLLVAEPWRCDDGGGNTLNNFFDGMDAEFAQVYCSALLPENQCCSRYYQMTDGEVIRGFFCHKKIGRVLKLNNKSKSEQTEEKKSRLFGIIKQLRFESFLLIKEYIWYHSNWKTDELKNFILCFNPDVIYAPCYASPFFLALTRWVKNLTGKKIVTWSADDNYSLRQFNLSPFFWIKRLWTRRCLRKTYPFYDAFYSISEDEAAELEPVVKKKIGILRKCVPDDLEFQIKNIGEPIQLIYAGGIYIQRWKVLSKIGKALDSINKDRKRCVLHIYTQNTLTDKQKRALNDGRNIYCHSAVRQDELRKLYAESDIALHVESQSLQNKLCTRLSFSTKIIDCLASGCAVMAIAWEEQTGLKYLKKNNAAICITDEKQIEDTLRMIIDNPTIIQEYAKAAYDLAIKKHDRLSIQGELFNRLVELSDKGL